MDITHYRVLIAIIMLVLTLITLTQTAVSWKHLSWGQKLYLAASILYMWYILDTLRVSIEQNVGFRRRLFLLAFAQALHLLYLLEPKSLTKRRRGKGMMEDPHEDDES